MKSDAEQKKNETWTKLLRHTSGHYWIIQAIAHRKSINENEFQNTIFIDHEMVVSRPSNGEQLDRNGVNPPSE